MSGAGGPAMGLPGPQAASEDRQSGAGGPVMGLQGPQAASEEAT
jgi:hypothetical protein